MKKTTEQRFWEKVDKSGDCWLWVAGRNSHGYGTFGVCGSSMLAHRVSWYLSNGTIPSGMYVCHKCDNTSCVNPSHLFLGTQKDNMGDCSRKGRVNRLLGERHPRTNLTEPMVKQMRELKGSMSNRELGRKFGVSKSCARNIVNYKRWIGLQ